MFSYATYIWRKSWADKSDSGVMLHACIITYRYSPSNYILPKICYPHLVSDIIVASNLEIMKILYITRNFLPSPTRGSEFLVYQWAKGMQGKGVETTVITSYASNEGGLFFPPLGKLSETEEIIDGIHIKRLAHAWYIYTGAFILTKCIGLVLRIPFFPRTALLIHARAKMHAYASGVVFKNLSEEINRIDPNIIHLTPIPQYYTYQTIRTVMILNKTRKKKIKLILTPATHFSDDRFDEQYVYEDTKFCLEQVDKIICTTNFERDSIIKKFTISPHKIEVVPIGIEDTSTKDLQLQSSEQQRLDDIRSFKKDKKGCVLLFVGAKNSKKGVFKLAAAAAQVQREHPLIVIVAGISTISWNIAMLLNRWLERNTFITDLTYIRGDEKEALYREVNIFALPSIIDSYGIVYLEAMQHNLPIIYADTPAQREVIGNAGLYSPFSDIAALAKNIKKLVTDANLRKILGDEGRKQFIQKYTFTQMIKHLESIYSHL